MFNIKFQGAIYNCSGYAQIRNIFLGLSKKGHSVRLEPFKSYDNIKFKDEIDLKRLEKVELKSPYINVVAGIAPQLRIDSEASYNIAFSMFETTEIPDEWVDYYNQFDEIWTPSEFCKKSYNLKSLNSIVTIMPLGVDSKFFIPKGRIKTGFTFLSVGKWIDRKGWDLLLKAYTTEFLGNTEVRLCIKTDNSHKTNEELIEEYVTNVKNLPLPRVMVKNKKIDEVIMPLLYQEADCFVLPSRGEAFCLPYLEAMSSGLPVIYGDFGGQMDFIKDEFGWPVVVDSMKKLSNRLCKINAAYKNKWFAEPSIDSLKKAMRDAYENRDKGILKGRKAREFVKSNFDWNIVVDKAEKRLMEISRALN